MIQVSGELGIHYFKWTGEGFAKQVIDWAVIGVANGCGNHFALADLRGSGRPDPVAPGKDGLDFSTTKGYDGCYGVFLDRILFRGRTARYKIGNWSNCQI